MTQRKNELQRWLQAVLNCPLLVDYPTVASKLFLTSNYHGSLPQRQSLDNIRGFEGQAKEAAHLKEVMKKEGDAIQKEKLLSSQSSSHLLNSSATTPLAESNKPSEISTEEKDEFDDIVPNSSFVVTRMTVRAIDQDFEDLLKSLDDPRESVRIVSTLVDKQGPKVQNDSVNPLLYYPFKFLLTHHLETEGLFQEGNDKTTEVEQLSEALLLEKSNVDFVSLNISHSLAIAVIKNHLVERDSPLFPYVGGLAIYGIITATAIFFTATAIFLQP